MAKLLGKSKTLPRPMSEINGEYNQLCAKIGAARYQIHRIDSDIRGFLGRIQEVEVEASERSTLDKETALSTGPAKSESDTQEVAQ